jgi:hypothetical protein
MLIVVGVIAAACGGGSAPPGIASLGSTTTTTIVGSPSPSPFEGPAQEYQYILSYAQCMRTHGVVGFPDPTLTSHNLTFNPKADSNSPQYAKANGACKHLLPDEGGPPTAAQIAAVTARLLRYATCMRAHGESSFPDPTVTSHSLGFSLKGMDPQSPQFQTAQKVCQPRSALGGR